MKMLETIERKKMKMSKTTENGKGGHVLKASYSKSIYHLTLLNLLGELVYDFELNRVLKGAKK